MTITFINKYVTILIILIIFSSCVGINKYPKDIILDYKYNSKEGISLKTIKTIYRPANKTKYSVTKYIVYDTMKRIIKEYGFEYNRSPFNMISPDDKYLIETKYIKDRKNIYNIFIWPNKNDSDFTPKPQYLKYQAYNPDTSVYKSQGVCYLYIHTLGDTVATGYYQNNLIKLQNKSSVFESEYFFKILTSKMKFDSSGKFQIENAEATRTIINSEILRKLNK